MAHYDNKHIVDADIARSAGSSVHPVSKSSRELLEELMQGDNEVYFCRKLLQEWSKHNSVIAKTWLSSMVSRKKAKITKDDHLALSKQIQINIQDEKTKSITTKDSHLIESAKKNGCIIYSNDNTARAAFSSIKKEISCIKEILWICPVDKIEEIKEEVLKKRMINKDHYI